MEFWIWSTQTHMHMHNKDKTHQMDPITIKQEPITPIKVEILGRGGYGQVEVGSGGTAIKHTKMFHYNRLGSNFNEATFAASLISRPIKNVVSIGAVTSLDDMFQITMERGLQTLTQHSAGQTWDERNECIHSIVIDVCTALLHLHRTGMVHCDLKPCNIILMRTGGVKLIDFGSARFWDRPSAPSYHKRRVNGTYCFCAPEVLVTGIDPTPACDAYSLGVTLYVYLMQERPFTPDKNMDVQEMSSALTLLHSRVGGIMGVTEPPAGMSMRIFRLLSGLLHPDPLLRTSIKEVARSYRIRLPRHVQTLVVNDRGVPTAQKKHFERMVDMLYSICVADQCEAAFPLSVSIALRYAAATRWPVYRRSVLMCLALAVAVVNPDFENGGEHSDHRLLRSVLIALEFSLYADTCDRLLASVHGHKIVDMSLICNVLKLCDGKTLDSVDMYLRMFKKGLVSTGFT